MKKNWIQIAVLTMLVLVVPASAYASEGQSIVVSKEPAEVQAALIAHPHEGHFKRGHRLQKTVSEKLLTLLKLDEKTFRQKLKEGKTLAQIAQDQGVSRDQLKKTMIEAHSEALDKMKKNFADHIDQMIDSQRKDMRQVSIHKTQATLSE
ncbi:MUN domain-containing protein [Paenibacillus guangzhouensis]|uniref:MUN domain-containing protein n=1 Tax=Paenibacillus guangzhouensis TaxID=1473112 RepID=UPI001266C0E9|nr:MUN domain-containing protein [Paenibacillus guangzhouensis]